MSRQKGKREAEREKWHKGGDPFAADSSERKKSGGLTGWKRTVAIALGCVVALAVIVAGAWAIFVKPPDVSEKIKVENNINNLEAGRYYIKYTIDDLRFGGVIKYRYIIYLDEEENIDAPTDENDKDASLNLVLAGGE